MSKENSKKFIGITDILKSKLLEVGKEYLKDNLNKTKNQILKSIEKTFEKKIKKEIKKSIYKILSYVLLSLGGLFLLYGILIIILELLLLPSYLANILFGFILIIIGFLLTLN